MKQPLRHFILFVGVIAALQSCTKALNTGTTNTSSEIFMNCTVNSDTLLPTGQVAHVFDGAWTSDVTLGAALYPGINITGSKSSNSVTGKAGQSIGFGFKNYPNATGTYNIDGVNVKAYWSNASGQQTNAVSGTIVLTKATQQFAAGTISFTCKDGTQVSNGTFSVAW
jgi:hypothetical protein